MDALHYKLFRLVIRDLKMLYPRDMLDTPGRAPDVFATTTPWVPSLLNTVNHGLPARLNQLISKFFYTIRRTGQIRSFDVTKKRISRPAIGNRIDHILQTFSQDCSTRLVKHDICKYLEKAFFANQVLTVISNNHLSWEFQIIFFAFILCKL